MKITAKIAQDAAIRAGSNQHGYLDVEVDIAKLTDVQRETLAANYLRETTDTGIYEPVLDLGTQGLATEEAIIQRLDAIILKEQDAKLQKEKAQAEYDAVVEKEVQRLLAIPQPEFNRTTWFLGHGAEGAATNSSRLTEKFAIREAYLVEQKAREEASRLAQDAERTAKELEKEQQRARKQIQITCWVVDHGTDSQKARLAADVLPEQEITDAMRVEAFLPLSGFRDSSPTFPLYEKLIARNICSCEYEKCHVEYESYPCDATAEEFDLVQKITNLIKAGHPEAEVQLREHKGTSEVCEETVTRKSVKVTLQVGVFQFVREYATSWEGKEGQTVTE